MADIKERQHDNNADEKDKAPQNKRPGEEITPSPKRKRGSPDDPEKGGGSKRPDMTRGNDGNQIDPQENYVPRHRSPK